MLTDLRTIFTITSNTPQGVQAGEVIQAMAAEAGFDVRVVAAEIGTVLAATMRGEFQVTLGGWSGLLDPDSNGCAFLHTGSALNIAEYSNPNADALLGQARAEGDPARRRALYDQLWRQVQADLPLIYLWTPRNILGCRARCRGSCCSRTGCCRCRVSGRVRRCGSRASRFGRQAAEPGFWPGLARFRPRRRVIRRR